jgi:hypothetical protein
MKTTRPYASKSSLLFSLGPKHLQIPKTIVFYCQCACHKSNKNGFSPVVTGVAVALTLVCVAHVVPLFIKHIDLPNANLDDYDILIAHISFTAQVMCLEQSYQAGMYDFS